MTPKTWDDLMTTVPAVSISRHRSHKLRDNLSPKWNDLGFRISPHIGTVEAVAVGQDPDEYRNDPSDERIVGTLPGEFRIGGAWLMAEGVQVAGVTYGLAHDVLIRTPASARAWGYARIADDYLFGAFSEGLIASRFGDDGELSLASRPDAYLTWRWPLEKIDCILVSTHKAMFKWVNAKLEILLSNADGSDAASVLGMMTIHGDQAATAMIGGKGMMHFARFLAELVAKKRGTTVTSDTKEGQSDRADCWATTEGLPDYWTSMSAEGLAG